jgi:hypothetical protein
MAAPGPGGGATGSLLIFSPRNELNVYYISSSATATQSNFTSTPTGNVPIPNNPLNTRLFYLGSGFTNASDEAGGWYASETSSFSGSKHNRLFWMYGNSTNFANEYSNLYYNTFQTMSTIVGGNTNFTQGIVPHNINATQNSPNNAAFISLPINAPAYNYQLIVSKSAVTSITTGGGIATNRVMAWNTLTQDSLRSGSGNTIFETSGQGYKGQFNTSSGQYTFIRANLPTASVTPIRAIPVDFTMSAEFEQNPSVARTARFEIIGTSSAFASTQLIFQSSPTTNLNTGTNYQKIVWSGSLNIYSGSANQVWTIADANPASIGVGPAAGIAIVITGSSDSYRSASLRLSQPLTGRQIAAEVPLRDIFNVTNTPTANDTGSYYVITPNLRGVDDVTSGGNYQLNNTFAVYYFKSAYHLWRDAWQVQAADGGPICSQAVWISASSNPSWAGCDIASYSPPSGPAVRNNSFLYSSRSAGTFIDYGTSSTDAAVRNRSYIGITAELLGGSELIKHLKGNAAGTISASFPGNKFGGMIVVKASNVSTDSSTAAVRYYPGTGNPSSFIYYKPGLSDGSQTTINNEGLPDTQVNNGDVVPFSNFAYQFAGPGGVFDPKLSNLDWNSSPAWPPANPYSANTFYT